MKTGFVNIECGPQGEEYVIRDSQVVAGMRNHGGRWALYAVDPETRTVLDDRRIDFTHKKNLPHAAEMACIALGIAFAPRHECQTGTWDRTSCPHHTDNRDCAGERLF